jgi:tetratricopeptide (TPR) repeat protein
MDKSPETKPQNLIQSENKTERIDGELKGTILDKNPVKNQELIAQLQHELDNFRNSGDILNEVWTLKRLGIFYRQLKQYAKSANYLNKALNLSVGLHDVTLQSEIYGELAYLNFKQGNKTQAEVYMKQCLDILRSVESKRTEYWIKKFKKF